jgi:hypothetical protein
VTETHPQGDTQQKESDEMQMTPGNAAAEEKEVVVVVVETELLLEEEESRQFYRESFPVSHILTSSPITIQEIQSKLRAGTFPFCL